MYTCTCVCACVYVCVLCACVSLLTQASLKAALAEHTAAAHANAPPGGGSSSSGAVANGTGDGGVERNGGADASGGGGGGGDSECIPLPAAGVVGGEWKLRCSEGVWVQVGGLWGDVVPALASKMLQVCVCVGKACKHT
jgi:uncharacterized membrane protein